MNEIIKITDYSYNLNLLLEQYKEATKLKGTIDALNDQADDLEQALFEIRDEFWIDTAIGIQLDIIGIILGLERKGLDDTTYRTLLKAKATLINAGEPETIISMLKLFYDATYVKYWGSFPAIPAGYYLYTDAIVTIKELENMSPAGVQPYLTGYIIDGNSTLSLLGQSSNFSGSPEAIAQDDEYLYRGGTISQYIDKTRKSDMVTIMNSPNLGWDISAIAVYGDYVYVCVRSEQVVKKLNKSDLSLTGIVSGIYGGDIEAIAVDYSGVYIGGFTTQTVRKLNLVTLEQEAESANYGGYIYAIALDGNYVYFGGATTQVVRKLDKNNLNFILDSASYGGSIHSLVVYGNSVFVGGTTVQLVRELRKPDLVQIGQTIDFGAMIHGLAVDDNNHIFVGASIYYIRKVTRNGLILVYSSVNLGHAISGLVLDSEAVYIIGGSNSSIKKVSRNIVSPNYLVDANGNKLFHVANP